MVRAENGRSVERRCRLIVKRRVVLLLMVLSGYASFPGCRSAEPVSRTRVLLHTYCKITIPGTEKRALEAMERAFERIARIDAKFDVSNPSGPFHGLNNNGVPLRDKEALGVVRDALRISAESDGAFDPTVYPLIKLWGFFAKPSLPGDRDIKRTLPRVGYQKVRITGDAIYPAGEGSGLDLGGIIAGYAADEARKALTAMGIRNALIDTGGEFYALGTNNGKKWRIGLKDPRGDGIVGIIEAQDEAVSTSGDYEHFFQERGKRYHHLLDPATGYPAEGVISATVIAPRAAEADAWSTALFIMGPEKGLRAVEEKKGFRAIVITGDGRMILSAGTGRQFSPPGQAEK